MGVNSLPKTVTRLRRGCDLNPDPTTPESSALTTRLRSTHSHYVYAGYNEGSTVLTSLFFSTDLSGRRQLFVMAMKNTAPCRTVDMFYVLADRCVLIRKSRTFIAAHRAVRLCCGSLSLH